MDFVQALKTNSLLFDGSFGAYIMSTGIETGDCIMMLNKLNPEGPASVHRAYMNAGANIATANTFIGSAISLKKHGISEEEAYELNKKGVEIAKKETSGKCFVGLDMGPSGGMLMPLGEHSFSDMYSSFAVQARAAKDAGADFVIVETMTDLAEARIAALCAMEITGLPVVVSLSFEHGRLLTGGTPAAAAAVLEAIGVSALGINCSGGPDEILPALIELRKATKLPIVVQPNAGVPSIVEGKTVFPLNGEDMLPKMKKIVEAGANAIGGCCGTRPEFIKLFRALQDNRSPMEDAALEKDKKLATGRDVFEFSGIDSLKEKCELEPGIDGLYDADPDADYAVLNVSGMDMDEAEEYMLEAQQLIKTPVLIDGDNDEVRRFAIKVYCGIAMTHGESCFGAIKV